MISLLFSALVGAVILLAYTIASRIHHARRRAFSNGCEPLPHYRHKDPIFGLDITVNTIRDVLANRRLVALEKLFRVYGPTFQSTTLGIGTIWSTDSRLIQYAYHENDRDWGVAPFRQEPMRPFCGQGFITTDGSVWKRSRALRRFTLRTFRISAPLRRLWMLS